MIRSKIFATSVVAAALVVGSLASGGAANAAAQAVGTCATSKTVTATSGALIVVPVTSGGSGDCRMDPGAVSRAVSALQAELNSSCGVRAGIAQDGNFGPATKAALQRAQAKYGVTADGIYGTNTARALGWPIFDQSGGCGFQRF
jgi:peptidoglycan hydrolase-like protein with peptidoglycan-binding domain